MLIQERVTWYRLSHEIEVVIDRASRNCIVLEEAFGGPFRLPLGALSLRLLSFAMPFPTSAWNFARNRWKDPNVLTASLF